MEAIPWHASLHMFQEFGTRHRMSFRAVYRVLSIPLAIAAAANVTVLLLVQLNLNLSQNAECPHPIRTGQSISHNLCAATATSAAPFD